MVEVTSELVAAVAAIVAALLSGCTLWVTGRREERKWRRDALIDTIVQFLDGSFASPGPKALRVRRAGGDLEVIRENADKAHELEITALTRLRVLAPTSVVAAAEAVHSIDDDIRDLALEGTQLPDERVWATCVERRRELRTKLLEASRRALKLGPAKSIESSRQQVTSAG